MPMHTGNVNRTYADIIKADKVLGYNPKTEFKEGINKFMEWIKKDNFIFKNIC